MFKVGDKVRIISDLNIDMDDIVKEMMEYAGKETTVNAISYGMYKLEIDGVQWYWSDEMLEKVETGGNDMTALEYFKTKARMTKIDNDGKCGIDCDDCAMNVGRNGTRLMCRYFEKLHAEKAIEIVQKWGEENPVKTYLSDFLVKHPNAPLGARGVPGLCPYLIGYCKETCCIDANTDGCVECWNRPYIDEFEEWLNA